MLTVYHQNVAVYSSVLPLATTTGNVVKDGIHKLSLGTVLVVVVLVVLVVVVLVVLVLVLCSLFFVLVVCSPSSSFSFFS